jgi:SynChlorMet cassette protein ScmC
VIELADGSRWCVHAVDDRAGPLDATFGETMGQSDEGTGGRRLEIRLAETREHLQGETGLVARNVGLSRTGSTVTCTLGPVFSDYAFSLQLARISRVLCLHSEERGGLLLHGALAARVGRGVILAGPGSAGKSTASNRLPDPWRSHSDDLTLVVRGAHGSFLAHPWPTWSRFIEDGFRGTWDTQNAVALSALYFLEQSHMDRAEEVGPAQAACLLVESAEQAWWDQDRGQDDPILRAHRLRRFDNICAIARAVPCHVLKVTRDGPFWEEIERTMPIGRQSAVSAKG